LPLRSLYFQRSMRARRDERPVVGRLSPLAIVNNPAVWRKGRGTDGCGTGSLGDTVSIMTEWHFPTLVESRRNDSAGLSRSLVSAFLGMVSEASGGLQGGVAGHAAMSARWRFMRSTVARV